MADTAVTDLTELAIADLAAGDLFYIVDVSEAGVARAKKVKVATVFGDGTNRVGFFDSSGRFIVRQSGGVAGTDEIRLSVIAGVAVISKPGGTLAFQDGRITMSVDGATLTCAQKFGVQNGGSTTALLRDTALMLVSGSGMGWVASATDIGGSALDTKFTRLVAGVAGVTNWLQQTGGHKSLAADANNDSATLATTGLAVNVLAGRTYAFTATLHVTTGAALEGVKAGLNGTATITDLIADVEVKSHAATPVFTVGRLTAFGTSVGQTVADAGGATVTIAGTLTVNAAGTLRVDFAKNADTGAANTTVARGSSLIVHDVVPL